MGELRPDILLHPNIPKPLHGLAPRTIMGKDWWDKNRKIAYEKAGFCCQACGVHKSEAKYHQWLEAHELYDIDYKNGTMTFKELVALCHSCHSYIHSGLLLVKYRRGDITKDKYEDILKHGDNITKGLNKPTIPVNCAKWEDWRLIFEGKEFKGKFKSFDDWRDYYNR